MACRSAALANQIVAAHQRLTGAATEISFLEHVLFNRIEIASTSWQRLNSEENAWLFLLVLQKDGRITALFANKKFVSIHR